MDKTRYLLCFISVFLLTHFQANAESRLPGCFAYCLLDSNSKKCDVVPGYETEDSTTQREFTKRNGAVKLAACAEQTLHEGELKLFFAVRSGIEEYVLTDSHRNKKFKDSVKGLEKNAKCLFPKDCDPHEYDGTSASVGGKGIDDNSQMKSDGSACALGLPCGDVLPSTEPVVIRFDNSNTRWNAIEIVQFRSNKAHIKLQVKDSEIVIPLDYFQPYETYVYKVLLGKKEVASGFYQVSSQEDVDSYLEILNKAHFDNSYDSLALLVEEGFLWDVGRLVY